MKVNGHPTRTLRVVDHGQAVEIIDQTLLPYRVKTRVLSDWRDCVEAICALRVRGPVLTGIVGAWAVVLAAKEDPADAALTEAACAIAEARPAVIELNRFVNMVMNALRDVPHSERWQTGVDLAEKLTQQSVDRCWRMGEVGAPLISQMYRDRRRPVNILTYGNAGWLSGVDYGTALSPVYEAFEQGTPLHVWVAETRPRQEGLLTAWELQQQGVPHTLVTDSACGALMQHGDVDLVILGADTLTRRGDVIAPAGSYPMALCACDNDIPVYVVTSTSGIDLSVNDGKREVPPAERPASEILWIKGLTSRGELHSVQIAPSSASVMNPAFDVTHNRFIKGIITEDGICSPTEVMARYARTGE